MEGWTTQRVLQLAPDPASAKAGQGLASPRKWVTSGADAQAVWGECQGSGSKPYQTQVDLSEPAFKCSCPSRKFPCKHGLGLMLLYAGDQVAAATEKPAWVTEWLATRSERAEKAKAKAEAPPKPVDEAAQAKRREKRLERVAEGLASLRLWIHDLVRNGIATAPSRGYAFFDEPARRMIDAQATGASGRIQSLGTIASSGAGWEKPFVEELASLELLIRAYERADQLPEPTRQDIFATLGLPISQDDVLALPPVKDRWQVISQEVTQEDRLRVSRTWLFGVASRRPALVLAFAHGSAPFTMPLVAGFSIEGELCYFPGNGVRAAIKTRGDMTAIPSLDGFDKLDSLCDAISLLRAQQPWLGEVVLPLRQVVPARTGNGWSLIDSDRRTLPAVLTDSAGWTLLAMSGGAPVDVAAGFDGSRLRPQAVMQGGEFRALVVQGESVSGEAAA
ncbi:SWIM zinc finger family protein [Humisphaera borealis]|uniref:SWIM zinc finger family protein n=1 Tax=Humisphaera borealis TaxID=2807512 RepID=A0A7M2WRU8_9BACT|nr:SWIM zinc finger family protein [Humisphaera borealis]QOV87330.1 SWIM zinc finger family protein [Humisphaera borealis]